MKKSLFVSLLALVLALGLGSVSFAQGDLYLAVDGKKVETDAPCFIENNRTLVPVRFISSRMVRTRSIVCTARRSGGASASRYHRVACV